MAIYRSSDSLRRCDPSLYSNIYDVRKRSDIKHQPVVATQPIQKDTIEISRDKLKEEALNRLRHTSKYVIAQNSFMRIGKYLFLAIAFPPYFVVYGLPRWVLVEGLPAIFSMCVWVWKKVQHHTEARVESGAQKVVQMMHFVQRLAQVLIQPIVHLALEIRQSIRRLRTEIFQFFKKIIHRAQAAIHFPHLKLAERFKQVQKRMSQIREKWSQQAQTMAGHVQEGIQWIKESPQFFLGWGQAQIQHLSQSFVSLGAQWKKRFQPSQQLAQRATDWVYKQFKKGIQAFKSNFEPLVNFYQQQLQPRWKKVKEICKGKWEQTRDFFHQKHQKALAFLQDKQEKLKLLSSLRLIHYFMSHPWMGKLPLRLQDWLKKCLSHPVIRAICERGVKAYSFLAHSFLQSAIYGLQTLSKGWQIFSKASHSMGAFVKVSAQKVLDFLPIGQRFFRRSLLYALYYFLLFVTIGFILFMWSLRSLGDLMSSLTSVFQDLGIKATGKAKSLS